MMMMIDDDELH